MRKLLLVASAIALVPMASFAIPALAQSSAASGGQQSVAESIDLGAIPVRTVARHLAISGIVADDEGDDMRTARAGGKGLRVMHGEGNEALAIDAETGEAE